MLWVVRCIHYVWSNRGYVSSSMDVLNQLFSTLKVTANVFHNGQYCGNWAIDTSGSSYISFHIVSHGRCFLSIDGGTSHKELLKAGDIVLFPRDSKHCLTNDEDFNQPINTEVSQDFNHGVQPQSTGLVCGYFTHQHPLVEKLTQHMPEFVVIKEQEDGSGLSLLLKALLQESLASHKGSALILAKLSEAILAMLFRDNLAGDEGILAAIAHPKLGKAIEVIHQQPQHKWTVETLAQCSHMSRAAFSELFKQITGQSPMEYLTQWRIALAYRLLADENASTLHAALSCGYDNESSFSKAFKRVLGISPGQVRAEATH